MELKQFVLFTILMVVLRYAESCGPSENFPPTSVLETDPAGHAILNFTAEEGVSWTILLKRSKDLDIRNPLFRWLSSALTINSDIDPALHIVELVHPMDLEFVYDRWQYKLSVATYQLTCSKAGASDTTFELFLSVKQVNEFSPFFIGAPFNISVPENSVPERIVMRLRDNASDEDVVTSGGTTDIHEFSMIPLPTSWSSDIPPLFGMSDKQDGEVRVNTALDFEAFPNAESAYLTYDITVYDLARNTNKTQLTIYIEDVDDQPPYFYYPGCSPTPCEVFYICEVDYDFTGKVTNMQPADIKAKDGDTLGYHIKYRIRTGPQSPRFRRFVTIHPRTGILKVLEPLGAYSTAEIVLIIQATEVSEKKHFKDTTLIVKIKYPDDYHLSQNITTPRAAASSSPKNHTKSVIIAVAVLAAFVLLAFMTLGALILYMKKRPEKPIYPIEVEDSEQMTEGALGPQRGGSNTDSGQWSMTGEMSAAMQPGPSTRTARGQPTMVRKGTKGGKRKSTSARSEMSSGETSVISAGDIYAQEDPQNGMMLQENMELAAMQNGMYPNGTMALVHAQMHGMTYNGNEALIEEDETDLGNGESGYEPPPQPRRKPPKSAPAGSSSKTGKTTKRAQTARKSRKEQPPDDSPVEDEF